jgi:peptide/nickel transport system ATP-binding protein
VTAAAVRGMRVERSRDGTPVVDDVSFSIAAGEVLAIAGEAGAGKTTLALAMLGYARYGMRLAGGEVRVGGELVGELSRADLMRFRARSVAYVPQDPATALNPALRVRTLVGGGLRRCNPGLGRRERLARVARALVEVGLPSDQAFLRRRPHELSGGQQQRVAIAAALVREPRLLVLDEPTTGLDATTQVAVLDTLRAACRRHSLAAVYITHDLAAVTRLGDRLLVLHGGRTAELGPAGEVLAAPGHPYTRRLLAALPRPAPASARREARNGGGSRAVLSVSDLRARFGRTSVLEGVSLAVEPGQCVALLGESAAGKTTLARCVAGLHEAWRGEIVLDGRPVERHVRERPDALRSAIQYVFQNPYRSLDPRRTAGDSIAVPLRRFRGLRGAELRAAIAAALDEVTLPLSFADRRPDELSGGERQLVAIARALACSPRLLVCDEVTSSLDTTAQATVVGVLARLRQERGMGVLFVTHDVALARSVASAAVVLRDGAVVEAGDARTLFSEPRHAYVQALLAAVPELAEERRPAVGAARAETRRGGGDEEA